MTIVKVLTQQSCHIYCKGRNLCYFYAVLPPEDTHSGWKDKHLSTGQKDSVSLSRQSYADEEWSDYPLDYNEEFPYVTKKPQHMGQLGISYWPTIAQFLK